MCADETKEARKGVLAFIFAVVLFDLIGFSIMLTIQSFIIQEYNTTALAVGLLTAIYAAAQFISAPILGTISDRYGRRPILLVCLVGSAIGYFIFGIGGALWILYISRIVDGLTGGNYSVAAAYVSDISPLKDRTKNMGILGAAFGLGFILGPLLGGLFSQINLAAPTYAAGVFSLSAAVIGFFILPESLPKERRRASRIEWRDLNPFASISKMLWRPILGMVLILSSMFNFVFNGFAVNVPVFLIDRFSTEPLQIAGVFLVSGLVMACVQGGLIGMLAQRFGDISLSMSGLLVLAIGFVLLLLAPSFWLVYLIVGMISAGAGLLYPTLSSLISKTVQPSEMGIVFGVTASLASLMNVFGPLWAGFVYDRVMPSAPYWMGAILLLIAFVLSARLKHDLTAVEENT